MSEYRCVGHMLWSLRRRPTQGRPNGNGTNTQVTIRSRQPASTLSRCSVRKSAIPKMTECPVALRRQKKVGVTSAAHHDLTNASALGKCPFSLTRGNEPPENPIAGQVAWRPFSLSDIVSVTNVRTANRSGKPDNDPSQLSGVTVSLRPLPVPP